MGLECEDVSLPRRIENWRKMINIQYIPYYPGGNLMKRNI